MCYSAMIQQNERKLGMRFQARVQPDMYDSLFQRRLAGEKLYLNKAMEQQFTLDAKSPEEMAIGQKIVKWHEAQIPLIEQEIFTQKKRLADAERTLQSKITKKAENDQRIASAKIEKLKFDLKAHKDLDFSSESEQRIYPGHYMSMLALNEKGEKVVMPVRYLLRPSNKSEAFDKEFNGCYNARLDSLDRVAWWKSALGSRHGLILVKKFYENVAVEDYQKGHALTGEAAKKKNVVLCFEPEGFEYMFIPTLWDKWEKKGEHPLYSAALITDEPAPEIAQAGHDRTPIFLKESAVDSWLHAKGKSVAELSGVLNQREKPRYAHKVMGAD